MHSIAMLPLFRLALRLDGAVSGAAGLITLALSGWLATQIGAPAATVMAVGVFLVAYALTLLQLARAASAPPWLMWSVVIGNGIWVAASIALAFSTLITPTTLGLVLLIGQAVAVLGFAELQFIGARRSVRQAFAATVPE